MSKKEKLKRILHAAHVLDKFDDAMDILKEKKQITKSRYKQIKKFLLKEHKRLSAELEAI
ncbi:MAG: hypothetical protein QXH80_02955 [Candidatus Nanoarchaeia archaeon]